MQRPFARCRVKGMITRCPCCSSQSRLSFRVRCRCSTTWQGFKSVNGNYPRPDVANGSCGCFYQWLPMFLSRYESIVSRSRVCRTSFYQSVEFVAETSPICDCVGQKSDLAGGAVLYVLSLFQTSRTLLVRTARFLFSCLLYLTQVRKYDGWQGSQ